jgi:glycosyltransferase involved in cell wall biosynthesis
MDADGLVAPAAAAPRAGRPPRQHPARPTIVVCCDHGSSNGGVAAVAMQSAIGLRERGYAVIYFCAEPAAAPPLAAAGVPIVSLGQRPFAASSAAELLRHSVWNRAAAARLARLLAGIDGPRIVHIHGWGLGLSASILDAAVRLGARTVYTAHDYALGCPNSVYFDFQAGAICIRRPLSAACLAAGCDRRASRAQKALRVLRFVSDRHLAGALRRIDRFVAVSRFCAERLNALLPEPLPFTVVRNPIAAQPGPRTMAERNAGFVMVGRLAQEKGCLDLAAAAAAAVVPCSFVGDGDLAAAVRAVAPAARITGWLAPAAVAKELRRARALIFPSRWYEASPLVVEEALAAGLPVVASSLSAAAERIGATGGGLVFEGGSSAALSAALGALGEDALVRRLSERAHAAYWTDPPTVERHVDALEALYRELAA